MARVHCPHCGIDVVTDPAGRCPEGHLVAPPAEAPPGPDTDTAGVSTGAHPRSSDDELREALEALSTEPPPDHDADGVDAPVAEAALPALAEPPPAAPPDAGTRAAEDERDDIQATLAALGVEAATEQRSDQADGPDRGDDERAAPSGQAPAGSPGPEAPDTGIDVGNFTAKGGQVGRARRRWTRPRR